MSLLSRLWLCVLVAMLLALGVSFTASLLTARSYLEQQLYAQANDAAASLALSMSQQSKDRAMSELLVQALFNSGHFESIVYRDVHGEVVTAKHSPPSVIEAPPWFVRGIALKAREGEAMVSDGWHQAGKVSIVANKRFAYAELWQGALRLLAWLGLVGALLACAIYYLIAWVKRPLAQLADHAQAISERRFNTLPDSNVCELNGVVKAMNSMSERLMAVFAEQAARISSLHDEANRDTPTGLANRGFFMGRLRDVLCAEMAPAQGGVIMLRLRDLGGLNQRLGRVRADIFIGACATLLLKISEKNPDMLPARLNGSDFIVLLPGYDREQTYAIAQHISGEVEAMGRERHSDVTPAGQVAWVQYVHGEQPTHLLSRVDGVLMQADMTQQALSGDENTTEPVRKISLPLAMTPEQWRAEIEYAISQRSFELMFYPAAHHDGRVIHREAMLRLRSRYADQKSTPCPEQLFTAGQFMAAALRLGRTADLDLIAVDLACAQIAVGRADVAVNVSAASITNPDFIANLKGRLSQLTQRNTCMWLEVSESGLTSDQAWAALDNFVQQMQGLNCKLGVEHFGRHYASLPRLYSMRLDYIKLDGVFVAELDSNPGNQRFIKAVVDIANSLGIAVIAENVATRAEWDTLQSLGLSGATGPIVTTTVQ